MLSIRNHCCWRNYDLKFIFFKHIAKCANAIYRTIISKYFTASRSWMAFENDDVLNAFYGTHLKRGRVVQMPPVNIFSWNTVNSYWPKNEMTFTQKNWFSKFLTQCFFFYFIDYYYLFIVRFIYLQLVIKMFKTVLYKFKTRLFLNGRENNFFRPYTVRSSFGNDNNFKMSRKHFWNIAAPCYNFTKRLTKHFLIIYCYFFIQMLSVQY